MLKQTQALFSQIKLIEFIVCHQNVSKLLPHLNYCKLWRWIFAVSIPFLSIWVWLKLTVKLFEVIVCFVHHQHKNGSVFELWYWVWTRCKVLSELWTINFNRCPHNNHQNVSASTSPVKHSRVKKQNKRNINFICNPFSIFILASHNECSDLSTVLFWYPLPLLI